MKITIAGKSNSARRKLAEELAKILGYKIADDGEITISDTDWYTHPRAYSIYCNSRCDTPEDVVNYDNMRCRALAEKNVDIDDMRNYDLIIDTDHYSLSFCIPFVWQAYVQRKRGALLCGAHCRPTIAPPENYRANTLWVTGDVLVSYMPDGNWYIIDGHCRLYSSPYFPILCSVKAMESTPNDTVLKQWNEVLGFNIC